MIPAIIIIFKKYNHIYSQRKLLFIFLVLSLLSLSFLITDDVYPLGVTRFSIFFSILFIFNNIVETSASNLFATLYENPNSNIVNSSFIIMFFSTLGEIIFTGSISFFGNAIEIYWNLFIGLMMFVMITIIFCFLYKYSKFKTSFR